MPRPPRPFIVALTLALSCAACRKDTPPDPAPGADVSPLPQVDASTPTAQDREVAPPAPAVLSDELLGRLGRDAWYGLYLMGKKVGHAHVWDRASRPDEPGRFAFGFEMQMSVGGGGQKNSLEASELRFYGGGPTFGLVETRFSSRAMGYLDERRALPVVVDGKPGLEITRKVDGAETVRVVAATNDSLTSQLEVAPLTLDGIEVGAIHEVRVFSWEREADETVTTKVLSIDARRVAGLDDKVATFEVRYRESGLTGRSIVTSAGTMLEMTVGPGLVLKLEDEAVAKSGIAGLDILGTALTSPTPLGSPHAIDRLELTLSGPSSIVLPNDPNQQVVTRVTGEKATHEVVLVRGPGAEVKDDELAEALAADATIDSTHPAIVARARELTQGLTTPREKVEVIAAWVHQVLDKKLATHLPTASTILEKKVGDCTEHTWLTVALLRAVGIAARPVYGVGYTGDGEKVFAYHAWVEVALDGRWHMIDPTWGQKAADATHLRLGSSLGEVASSMGGLEVIRAEVKPAP